MSEGSSGKGWFVGAGPGAVDLLTVRAQNLLAGADFVLFDALIGAEILQLAPQARQRSVGKRFGSASTDQAEIDRLLVQAARDHAQVVRLKGGDPTVFGRLDEEIDALNAAGIAWEIVPGVTAATAAAAALGRSLTRRGRARRVVIATPRTGRGEPPNQRWAAELDPADTVVLYMAAHVAQESASALLAEGFASATAAAVVYAASRSDQTLQRTTLGELDGGAIAEPAIGERPALLVIGEPARSDRVPSGGGD